MLFSDLFLLLIFLLLWVMFFFPSASESLQPAHKVWSWKDHSLLHLWKLPQPTAAAPACLTDCLPPLWSVFLPQLYSCLSMLFHYNMPQMSFSTPVRLQLPFSREIIRTALWFWILFSEVTLTCAQVSPSIHTVCSRCNETHSKCSRDITLTRMGRS